MTSKGIEMGVVLELMGHIAVSFLPMAIPLSALFATIYTMNKLSEDSEVVAMRSFGLKKSELFAPFLLLGVAIALAIFSLNRNLIPHSKTLFKNTIIQLTSKGMVTNIKSGQFFSDIPDVTLFAEKVNDGGTKMEDVFIKLDKGRKKQIIFAKKGALIKQTFSKLRTPSIRLHLMDGNITTLNNNDEVEKVVFKEYDFPVVSGGVLPGFVTKDSMRSNDQLRKVIKERKEYLEKIKGKKKLNNHERHERDNINRNLPKSELEFFGRWNTPFQVMIFIFLGFSLGIKKGRGRSKNSGTIGLIILFAYYAVFFLGVSMARKGNIPASVAVFLPTVVAAFIGAHFFRKIDWFS